MKAVVAVCCEASGKFLVGRSPFFFSYGIMGLVVAELDACYPDSDLVESLGWSRLRSVRLSDERP